MPPETVDARHLSRREFLIMLGAAGAVATAGYYIIGAGQQSNEKDGHQEGLDITGAALTSLKNFINEESIKSNFPPVRYSQALGLIEEALQPVVGQTGSEIGYIQGNLAMLGLAETGNNIRLSIVKENIEGALGDIVFPIEVKANDQNPAYYLDQEGDKSSTPDIYIPRDSEVTIRLNPDCFKVNGDLNDTGKLILLQEILTLTMLGNAADLVRTVYPGRKIIPKLKPLQALFAGPPSEMGPSNYVGEIIALPNVAMEIVPYPEMIAIVANNLDRWDFVNDPNHPLVGSVFELLFKNVVEKNGKWMQLSTVELIQIILDNGYFSGNMQRKGNKS